MDWLQQNYVAIFAVIGALYTAALMFVKLTPTPRDDAALEKVGVALKLVAAIFGLSLKQGLESKPSVPPEANRKGRVRVDALLFTLVVVLVCSALHGCVSPGEQYQAASIAFVGAVDAASELRRAGKLDADEVREIGLAVDDGAAALNAWADALQKDEDYPDGPAVVRLAVSRIAAHLKVE